MKVSAAKAEGSAGNAPEDFYLSRLWRDFRNAPAVGVTNCTPELAITNRMSALNPV